MHQGRIERFFLDSLKQYSDIEVERGVLPDLLELDTSKVEDPTAYPIRVRLRHLSDEEATPAQGNSHSMSENAPEDGLFRSNLALDDTDDLIRKNKSDSSISEVVYAKYAIGCDGAHSWTRSTFPNFVFDKFLTFSRTIRFQNGRRTNRLYMGSFRHHPHH